MKIKNKIIFVIIAFSVALSLVFAQTIAQLQKEKVISYLATTGKMICEYEIDKNDSYVENGVKYFLITVTNFKNDLITDVDIKYTLTINNKNGSNGVYKWVKVDTNDSNNNYEDSITTKEYLFTSDSKQSTTFKVYVQLNKDQKKVQDTDIDIELNAVQLEKNTSFESGGK